jgi:single-strand DNA-binding protein
LAENCYNLGRKGRGVRVVGRLKQDRWPGQDGKNHSRVMIVAEHVEFRPEFRKEEPAYTGKTNAAAKEAARSTGEASSADNYAYAAPSESEDMAADPEAQFPVEELEEVAF